ncbi:hypothetical protein QYE76_032973 [Lolium multiflorum]|uniref:Uncharacterized protein n=1 Tax=Lolium multiflorum TaxID=4521 RepID=A0AAD8QUG6_LOLMU|nr:hypothetical protein QYE76_032973 [Lolium multiflorum]
MAPVGPAPTSTLPRCRPPTGLPPAPGPPPGRAAPARPAVPARCMPSWSLLPLCASTCVVFGCGVFLLARSLVRRTPLLVPPTPPSVPQALAEDATQTDQDAAKSAEATTDEAYEE